MYSAVEHYHDFDTSGTMISVQMLDPLYRFKSPYYSIRGHVQTNFNPIASYHQQTPATKYGLEAIMIASIPQYGLSSEYRFMTDCCRFDMKSYFEQDSIIDAVAINGVYFDFKTDYAPIGCYKQHMLEIKRDIPVGFHENTSLYESYYRAITIKDGILDIDSRSIHDVWNDRDRYSHVMVSGPILIEHGQQMLVEEDLLKRHDTIPIFQCDKPTESEKTDTMIQRNHETILSCDRPAGELQHLANTNPRSAIAISKDGTAHFICVPGRIKNYLGMDIVQLSQAIKKYIPDVQMAIGLDGGASSKLIHKYDNTIHMSLHNTKRDRYYIGNMISYQKVTSSFIPIQKLSK
jgi:hypothetical protein